MDTLTSFDSQLFLALNGAHCGYCDSLMWNLSSRLAWLPVLLVLIYVLLHKGWRQALLAITAIALAVVLADQLSSGLIKHLVCRLRPTHDPSLALAVHVVDGYRGGTYGFVSSHAANMTALAVLLCCIMRQRVMWWVMLPWVALVSYSRIYLGVHFPGDVVCGALVGAVAGLLVARLWHWVQRRWFAWQRGHVFNAHDARLLSFSLLANLLIIAVIACFAFLPR